MKRGFTLVELLAVIVILAIIALIATPIVINIISDTKESSLLRSADFYLDAVEFSIANRRLNNKPVTNSTYTIMSNGNICLGTLTGTNCSDTLVVEVAGETPISGTITLEDGVIKNHTLTYQSNIIIVDGSISTEAKSFAEDSWDTIVANVRAGNLSKYNVGDTKEIALTGFPNEEPDSNGLYTIRIANTSTPSECSNPNFSQTACGFVIEFEEIILPSGDDAKMNLTNTNAGGWKDSKMRTYVNSTIYESLPEKLRNSIIETIVVSGHGNTSGENNFTTTDKLYLLSTAEVWEQGISDKINLDTARNATRQLDYYKSIGVTTTNYSGAIKKHNGTAKIWWLRSAYSNSDNSFYGVNDDGDWNNNYAGSPKGVAMAFRIG